MDIVLTLVVLVGMWTGAVMGVAELLIEPPIVLGGDSVQITCSATGSFLGLHLLKITAPDNELVADKLVAALTPTPTSLDIFDADVKIRVPESHVTVSASGFTLNYTHTKCGVDGYTYSCSIQANVPTDKPPTKSLTVIDATNFKITSLDLLDTRQCPGDIGQADCDKCTKGDSSLPVREKDLSLTFVCDADLVFPSEQPNTFTWYIKDIDGVWEQQGKTDSPLRKTPTKGQQFCYNSTEAHESRLVYTPRDDDPRLLEVMCKAVLDFEGLSETREQIVSVCVIGGKETRTTPPNKCGCECAYNQTHCHDLPAAYIDYSTGKASTTETPLTTPKSEGKDKTGFSLVSGAGIVVLAALIVVVIAGVSGAGYWYIRRQRAQPQENPEYYYAEGENYT